MIALAKAFVRADRIDGVSFNSTGAHHFIHIALTSQTMVLTYLPNQEERFKSDLELLIKAIEEEENF